MDIGIRTSVISTNLVAYLRPYTRPWTHPLSLGGVAVKKYDREEVNIYI